MIELLIVVALQGGPDANLCAAAYGVELQRRSHALGLSSPSDAAKLSSAQRQDVVSWGPFLDETRTWLAVAFRQDQTLDAMTSDFSRLAQSPADEAATFSRCGQVKPEDLEPSFEPPLALALGANEQCADEDAAFFKDVHSHSTADVVREHAGRVMSELEAGTLTCRSLGEERYVWMEVGAEAAAAIAKDVARQPAR